MTAAGGAPGGVVLCLNAGSSSLKTALYRFGADGSADAAAGAGGPAPMLLARDTLERADGGAGAAVEVALARLGDAGLPAPAAVGHRVVHGGAAHTAPALVTDELFTDLEGLVPFAPLHQPAALRGIEAVAKRLPGVPQVACFDTAFHRRMPEVAQRLPLPRRLWDEGVRRYGFHGLSYEYVIDHARVGRQGRTVVAHLGNGASLAAVRDGQPLDTTMGFTPSGGLVMGTRPGDLDPGVLVYLAGQRGYDPWALQRLVDHEGGLRGVSGSSGDMRDLLARGDRDPAAALAVELFCYQLRKHLGALAAVLGGLDTLVFTGGIGERAAPVRERACEGLEHLGVRLDPARNRAGAPVISQPGSPCTVHVVATDEDLVIARHTHALTLATASG
jgi:acetate kinase